MFFLNLKKEYELVTLNFLKLGEPNKKNDMLCYFTSINTRGVFEKKVPLTLEQQFQIVQQIRITENKIHVARGITLQLSTTYFIRKFIPLLETFTKTLDSLMNKANADIIIIKTFVYFIQKYIYKENRHSKKEL